VPAPARGSQQDVADLADRAVVAGDAHVAAAEHVAGRRAGDDEEERAAVAPLAVHVGGASARLGDRVAGRHGRPAHDLRIAPVGDERVEVGVAVWPERNDAVAQRSFWERESGQGSSVDAPRRGGSRSLQAD